MPTYIDWDRTVLEECYDVVDGISLHRYWGNTEETRHDSQVYMAMNLTMDRQIAETVAVCDMVRARKRPPNNCGCRLTSGTCGIARAAETT